MVNTRLVRCRHWPTGSTNTSSYCNDVMWIAVIIISSMGRKKEKELREMTDHSSLLFISESLVANSHQYRPSSSSFLKKKKKKSGRPIWSSDMASRIGFEGFYFLSFFLSSPHLFSLIFFLDWQEVSVASQSNAIALIPFSVPLTLGEYKQRVGSRPLARELRRTTYSTANLSSKEKTSTKRGLPYQERAQPIR